MYYTLAVIFTADRLRALQNLIRKIEAEVRERWLSEHYVLDVRLADDMFPFMKQIQIATDNAKGMASRLSGKDVPSYPDEEQSLSELIIRIEKTIVYLETMKEEDFIWAEDREARFAWFPGAHMKWGGYLLSYAIPNFMFHISVAYSLLRHQGFTIGKSDFLGTLPLMPDGKEIPNDAV